jgi:hypothetical protein
MQIGHLTLESKYPWAIYFLPFLMSTLTFAMSYEYNPNSHTKQCHPVYLDDREQVPSMHVVSPWNCPHSLSSWLVVHIHPQSPWNVFLFSFPMGKEDILYKSWNMTNPSGMRMGKAKKT